MTTDSEWCSILLVYMGIAPYRELQSASKTVIWHYCSFGGKVQKRHPAVCRSYHRHGKWGYVRDSAIVRYETKALEKVMYFRVQLCLMVSADF